MWRLSAASRDEDVGQRDEVHRTNNSAGSNSGPGVGQSTRNNGDKRADERDQGNNAGIALTDPLHSALMLHLSLPLGKDHVDLARGEAFQTFEFVD